MNQSGSAPVLRSAFSSSGVRRFDSSAEADSYGANRRHSEEESSWWASRKADRWAEARESAAPPVNNLPPDPMPI
jgi:hypothetical protein